MIPIGGFQHCYGTRANAKLIHAWTAVEWGEDSEGLVKSVTSQTFKRHHTIAKKSAFLTQ